MTIGKSRVRKKAWWFEEAISVANPVPVYPELIALTPRQGELDFYRPWASPPIYSYPGKIRILHPEIG